MQIYRWQHVFNPVGYSKLVIQGPQFVFLASGVPRVTAEAQRENSPWQLRSCTFQLYLCSQRCVCPHVNVTLYSSLCCFQVYACMMVFFLSNMIENQLMSTGAFEITFNGEFSIMYCNFYWVILYLQSENAHECHEFDSICFSFIFLP